MNYGDAKKKCGQKTGEELKFMRSDGCENSGRH